MDCTEARPLLHALRRQRLPAPADEAVRTHLASCENCRRAHEVEAALDELLRDRLPRRAAPAALQERLASLGGEPARPRRRWSRLVAPALAAGLAVATGVLLVERRSLRESRDLDAMSTEAVNDHLRVLASQRPLEVDASGSHEVKPWFEGKLDFAPSVPLPDAAGLRLAGGAVGYFLDRKCAVVEYALRRHAVTLLVFPADGLAWPSRDAKSFTSSSRRGYHAVFWRAGELGYSLVSDVNPVELGALAERFAAAMP